MKSKLHFTAKSDIRTVIAQRLNLNTNQRILWHEYNIPFATLDKVENATFIKTHYAKWPETKQTRFLDIIGGSVNRLDTQRLIEEKL